MKNSQRQEKHQNEPFPQQLQAALDILKFIQGDYFEAKNQLEKLYHSFDKREALTSERLRLLTMTSLGVTELRSGVCQKTEPRVVSGAATVRAHCLGSFEIYLNWKKVDNWHSLKAKSLMKFLVTQRRKPVPKDVLVETLWPNCESEIGNNNLKTAVYTLRRTLAAGEPENKTSPVILFLEGHYLINPKTELWVDLEEFESHWLAGLALEREMKPEESVKLYLMAEELYKGDYLADDPYSEWTLLQRESLKDTYLAILDKLARSFFEKADYERCIVFSQKILAKDVCHEEAYRWLMRCYSSLGQRHRARRWYDICTRTLKREMDAPPDPQTTALLEELMGEDRISNL